MKIQFGVIVIAGLLLLGAVGATPRYVEELRVGGGAFDADGGVDIDKTGNVITSGNVQLQDNKSLQLGNSAPIFWKYNTTTGKAEWTDGANVLMSLTDAGTTGALNVSGPITFGGSNNTTIPKFRSFGSHLFHVDNGTLDGKDLNRIGLVAGERVYGHCIEGDGDGGRALLVRNIGAAPCVGFDRINGTLAAPTAVNNGDDILKFFATARNPNGTHSDCDFLYLFVDGAPSGDVVPLSMHLGRTVGGNLHLLGGAGSTGATFDPTGGLALDSDLAVNGGDVATTAPQLTFNKDIVAPRNYASKVSFTPTSAGWYRVASVSSASSGASSMCLRIRAANNAPTNKSTDAVVYVSSGAWSTMPSELTQVQCGSGVSGLTVTQARVVQFPNPNAAGGPTDTYLDVYIPDVTSGIAGVTCEIASYGHRRGATFDNANAWTLASSPAQNPSMSGAYRTATLDIKPGLATSGDANVAGELNVAGQRSTIRNLQVTDDSAADLHCGAPDNLVYNGNMEGDYEDDAAPGWACMLGNPTQDAATPYKGTRSQVITNLAGPVGLMQVVSLTAGKTYLVTWAIKTPAGSAPIQTVITGATSATTYVSVANPVGAGWGLYSARFTATTTESAYVSFLSANMSGYAECEIDTVSVRDVSPGGAVVAENLNVGGEIKATGNIRTFGDVFIYGGDLTSNWYTFTISPASGGNVLINGDLSVPSGKKIKGGFRASNNAAGVSGTITIPKLTSGGANGSMTVADGIITAFTNPS